MEPIRYSLFLDNKSSHNISVLIGNLPPARNYPDMALPDSIHDGNIIKVTCTGQTKNGACHVWSRELKWTEWAESLPLDTFSLFLFDTDTLACYSWSEIKTEYKILQRYDLSSGDIKKLLDEYDRVIIPYPPTEAIKDMKMYPPYGE
ncbi:hypothetical protein FACS189413_19790 [Bacteroidia bacterium]|nr:hypothetical protein FACS189463_3240 [Bacteroidia bacterium]GHU75183.1 hypothetical protein FACS189413_19790 [Bacteroidia bacterium]